MYQQQMAKYVAETIFIRSAEKIDTDNLPIDKMRMSAVMEAGTRGLIVSIDSYFHAIPERRICVHKKWPLDWWQAFRERWFPEWWLKKHPVEWDRVDVDEAVTYGPVCPHIKQPKQSIHLNWMANKDTTGWAG